ncbi:MAG: DUF3872 domain-containing protein [Bacteroidales bacterium]|jgi:hypothetical protein|nr:DUF3872 domain-containing protein [Bacteroidales bacterium]
MKRDFLVYVAFVFFVFGLFVTGACNDSELEIKNDYEFTVTHLPVPKRLKKGETAEIRFELVRSGKYDKAKYFVRYFQTDGKGALTLHGKTLYPNDGYELKKDEFCMYYTSECEDQQNIDLTFYDNMKNTCELSFSFSNDSKTEK